MRNRASVINVRVTPEEKKKLAKNAKRCGLSLSGYIRNIGFGREINPIPDKEYYRIYHLIDALRDKAPSFSSAQIDAMEQNDCTPFHAQSIRLKKMSLDGVLNEDARRATTFLMEASDKAYTTKAGLLPVAAMQAQGIMILP